MYPYRTSELDDRNICYDQADRERNVTDGRKFATLVCGLVPAVQKAFVPKYFDEKLNSGMKYF